LSCCCCNCFQTIGCMHLLLSQYARSLCVPRKRNVMLKFREIEVKLNKERKYAINNFNLPLLVMVMMVMLPHVLMWSLAFGIVSVLITILLIVHVLCMPLCIFLHSGKPLALENTKSKNRKMPTCAYPTRHGPLSQSACPPRQLPVPQ